MGLNNFYLSEGFSNKDILYKIASTEIVTGICEVVDSIFGSNPRSVEIFSRWIRDPQYHVTTATYEGKIIAVGASCYSEKPNLAKYEIFGRIATDFLRDQKVGWILTLAVLPQFRKNKIGWTIANNHRDWLNSKKVTRMAGSSWVTGSADNSTPMFTKAGFSKLGESREFLRNQLSGTGSLCAGCGNMDCKCLSVLFGRIT